MIFKWCFWNIVYVALFGIFYTVNVWNPKGFRLNTSRKQCFPDLLLCKETNAWKEFLVPIKYVDLGSVRSFQQPLRASMDEERSVLAVESAICFVAELKAINLEILFSAGWGEKKVKLVAYMNLVDWGFILYHACTITLGKRVYKV